jgi:hypothetical protein
MRKTSKAVLSAGLAAATVISGLSFGAAAATAAPTIDTTATPAAQQTGIPLMRSARSALQYHSTANAAGTRIWQDDEVNESSATKWDVPAIGDTGRITRTGTDDCLYSTGAKEGGEDVMNIAACDRLPSGSVSTFTLTGDGRLTQNGGGVVSITNGTTDWFSLSTSYSGNTWVGATTGLPFTAVVDSVDASSKSATITGTALPGATILIDGEDEVVAGTDGRWSVTKQNLPLGATTEVTADEYVKQSNQWVKKQTRSVDVNFELANLTAQATFPSDAAAPLQISGVAQPGARIEVRDSKGTVVASGTASSSLGSYTVAVPAPNQGGAYALTVDQIVEGERLGGIRLTPDYGTAVTVTSPVNDKVHDGGPVAMGGAGVAGGKITVREQGKQNVIGDATVLVNGRWNLDTTDLNAKKHVLEVTQKSKGNNTTTATVTLNPDADQQDVTVTSPKNGDQYDANTVLRFTGQGTPGAQIELDPNNGLSKYYGTVKADGTWSIDRPMGTGAYTFSAIQRVNGFEQSRVDGIAVTAKSTAPIEKPFKLSSPEANSFHQGVNVSFTGEGKPGDTVRLHVTNFTSADVTTTVKNDGTWSVSKYLGSGAYTFDITQENGGTVTGAVRGFELNQSVDKPFTVTSPTTGTTFTANTNVAFTGTGPIGAAITVKPTNGLAPVNTVIGANGTWTVAKFLGNGSYTFEVTMTPKTGAPQTSAPITITPTK